MIKEITPNMYGKRFSCTIEGCFVEEAVADVNKHGEVFILQNRKSGWHSGDLLDKYNGKYIFTWNVMRGIEEDLELNSVNEIKFIGKLTEYEIDNSTIKNKYYEQKEATGHDSSEVQ